MNKRTIKIALLVAGILLIVIFIVMIIAQIFKKEESLYLPTDTEIIFGNNEQSKEEMNYKEIQIHQMEIQAKEINDLIEAKWQIMDVNLGTIESRINEYDIYFDEGLEVKTTASKVFNLVFTNKYENYVINNLKVGANYEEIIEELGEPSFKEEYEYYDDEEQLQNHFLIGYKGENIYVFFTEYEISIYRAENNLDTTKFVELLEEFETDGNVFNLGNTLTDIWTDYDNYIYDETHVVLNYATKGIRLIYGYGNENGIILYNNFSGKLHNNSTLQDVADGNVVLPGYIYIYGNTDSVFEVELNRFYNMLRKL